jgi:hypothetical protein
MICEKFALCRQSIFCCECKGCRYWGRKRHESNSKSTESHIDIATVLHHYTAFIIVEDIILFGTQWILFELAFIVSHN